MINKQRKRLDETIRKLDESLNLLKEAASISGVNVPAEVQEYLTPLNRY